ncbi:MAG: phosphatidylglycerophosphatase A [Rickettsiales bacterium]|nr:phosphatidylglycerophosphatase A [Pseudomonadota bacterium]MDA0965563.1 phosphatidylglycerophosphatase A [Pseudomonadota bacterium]MDG4542887.1 phosphatidylglycerophosphatase A [Rickettsiales bacterium]MDG4544665.1 phosphatidylglycerophosphatase A [Rickettsiales bacterium]MDG4546787.1 phosphatidylglycerophosphatase A [Rickettsiales bacterium]
MTKNTEETQKTETPKGISRYHPAFIIATWFGSGKIPFAPGTMGSFFTFPLFILSHVLFIFADTQEEFTNLYLLCITLLFIIGQWATSVYMKRTGRQDPKEVVIDEVVGQMLVFFSGFVLVATALPIFHILYSVDDKIRFSIDNLQDLQDFFINSAIFIPYTVMISVVSLVGFILFRIFDIWKPWPIKWCDKNIKSSFGVMFDDIFAAVYAIIVMYLIAMLLASGFFAYNGVENFPAPQ